VLFITHDLSLLLEISHQRGDHVRRRDHRTGARRTIPRCARHPYTLGLLQSFPPLHWPARAADRHPGRPARPSPCRLPGAGSIRLARSVLSRTGLFSHGRRTSGSVLREIEPDHLVACHLVEEEERA